MIFNNVRQLPLSENKVRTWQNKVASSLNAHNIIEGDGINIDYTPEGAIVSLDTIDDKHSSVYVGDFDINKEYFYNQIVTVNINSNFINYQNNSISFGVTSTYSGSVCPINPGLYICTAYVPPSYANSTWLNTYIVPQYPAGTSLPFEIVNATRFYEANIYYPIYPIIPTQYTASIMVNGGANAIMANQNYWQPLVPSVPMQLCINGQQQTFYVNGQLSGSFDKRYLAHSV
jgi:hypothetical protein